MSGEDELQNIHHLLHPQRLLEEDDDSEEDSTPSSDIVLNTLLLYGSIFLVLFAIFLCVRKRYPRAYNVRGVSKDDELHSTLASRAWDEWGSIGWIWKVFTVGDEELFEHCGLDATAMLRILRFGSKMALVGCFNSLYLVPIYAASEKEDGENDHIDDGLDMLNIGHVPSGESSLFAAVVAAYVLYLSAMYFLFREFKWFTTYRHKFLSRRRPDNYTVYVGGIPEQYRSDAALLDYFRSVFGYDNVLDARVALDIPGLEKKVAERDSTAAKLEHAINVRDVTGVAPTHKKMNVSVPSASTNVKESVKMTETVDSISTYAEDLNELNEDVSSRIDEIFKATRSPKQFRDDLEKAQEGSALYRSVQNGKLTEDAILAAAGKEESILMLGGVAPDSALDAAADPFPNHTGIDNASRRRSSVTFNEDLNETVHTDQISEDDVESATKSSKKKKKKKGHRPRMSLESLDSFGDSVKGAANQASKAAKTGASLAAMTLLGSEDGRVRDAGFVSFANVRTKAMAIQALHHPTPFAFNVLEAPLPKDVYWKNVGMPHKKEQTGRLAGLALTVVTCLLWTIPMTFVASLGKVDTLKELLPFLEDWVDTAPWLEMALAQVAPLALVCLVLLLPIILIQYAKFEGHISEATLQASLFSKLAAFQIVQTFFVSAISGGIMEALNDIADKPEMVIDLLATSLPAQNAVFMQFVMVNTFLGVGIELLRISPVAIAYLRSKVGPNITEKERNTTWMGLNPLADPPEFEHAEVMGELILNYTILFVYSVMSPITSFLMVFAFLMLGCSYRHQFIFIYPTSNDTGGQLWERAVKVIITCMLIAQVTLFGVLGLKKSPITVGLLIPLIIITFLFSLYLKQKHYEVTKYLPSVDCIRVDLESKAIEKDEYDFVKGKYLQPALQEKVVYPENMDDSLRPKKLASEGSMNFFTPPASDAGGDKNRKGGTSAKNAEEDVMSVLQQAVSYISSGSASKK